METSAPKRRRTSPRTSVAIHNGNNDQSTTPPDPPPGSAQRPSFASPTKASLARHNPDILDRRRPASKRQGDMASESVAEGEAGSGMDATSAQAPAGSEAGTRQPPPSKKAQGSMASRPRRSPDKPNPEPLLPPGSAPDDDDDVLNPFMGRGLRRSGAGVLPATEEEPEPELPPTPENPDPEITTPPSGIHRTPSKRPRRSKSLAAIMRSSPLKQPPMSNAPADEGANGPNMANPKRRPGRRISAIRGVEPNDPDKKKKKLRDSLLAEVEKLKRDLDIVAAENERIRQARLTRSKMTPLSNDSPIVDVLRRHALPHEADAPDATADWLQAALNPMAFLPFSKPGTAIPSLPPAEPSPTKEEPPISHHPIAMTAEEELPYLQTFTPLAFNSTVTILPQDTPDSPILQKHSITASSSKPPGLFTAQIDITVDTETLAITTLAVPRLDPSAMSELNPFIESVVSTAQSSSAVTNNISILAWAMSEWLRVALNRAKFWLLLEKELGTKEALLESVARVRTRKKRRRRRQDAEQDDDGEDGPAGREGDSQDGDGDLVSRAELLPHMGRTSMDLDVPIPGDDSTTSRLRVQWRIEFDWTGEAQSRIGILLGVPGKWRKADERGNLAGLSNMFNQLVLGNQNPASAVKTVVALLAGDPF